MITLQEIIERDKRPVSVTVYMTCYNHEKYIDQAIQGVLMQKTNFPVNIVIHDDASPDGSGEIIRRYAAENDNITAIIEETNFYQNGKSFFPLMLPYLTGKYLAYCECDDFWLDENKLQKQVDYLESHPNCIAVYSNSLPVNKYGEYDETKRVLVKTGEGDYSPFKISGLVHQLATLVYRNFWPFMSEEEFNYYVKNKAYGDQKILAMCLLLRGEGGTVHYFAQEFAAYRKVTDEGDSYSAHIARLSRYENYRKSFRHILEIHKLITFFSGKKYDRKYLFLLFTEVKSLLACHKSIASDLGYSSFYREIPFYIYCIFPFYAVFKTVRKIFRVLLKALRIARQRIKIYFKNKRFIE